MRDPRGSELDPWPTATGFASQRRPAVEPSNIACRRPAASANPGLLRDRTRSRRVVLRGWLCCVRRRHGRQAAIFRPAVGNITRRESLDRTAIALGRRRAEVRGVWRSQDGRGRDRHGACGVRWQVRLGRTRHRFGLARSAFGRWAGAPHPHFGRQQVTTAGKQDRCPNGPAPPAAKAASPSRGARLCRRTPYRYASRARNGLMGKAASCCAQHKARGAMTAPGPRAAYRRPRPTRGREAGTPDSAAALVRSQRPRRSGAGIRALSRVCSGVTQGLPLPRAEGGSP